MTTTTCRAGAAGPTLLALVATMAVLACAPALDWRETRPAGAGMAMSFPCRPEKQERPVRIGAQTVLGRLHSCSAAGASFALLAADVADPARVAPMLDLLRRQAAANVGGTVAAEALPVIAGTTANPESARLRIVGQRPDGRRVVEHALFFVKGLTLFQATVIDADEPVGREAIDIFFESIRFP
ncbi:MAG: hypothetical protein ABI745_12125 [Caldimonas sp.]